MSLGPLFEPDGPEATRSAGGPGTEADVRGRPLAERMRPTGFDELVGQPELLGPGQPLREAIERDTLHSIILWGPPGTGKTTIARLIAATTRARFVAFSAVLAGIKDVKAVMAEAEVTRRQGGRRTIVFVDEIHRFNRAQQDAFLPRVEAGDIVLIGATTENPSFEVNAALLSRSKVYVLHPLPVDATVVILQRALADPHRGLGGARLTVDPSALDTITRYASGDARVALNLLELVAATGGAPAAAERDTPQGEREHAAEHDPPQGEREHAGETWRIDRAQVARALQARTLRYDKTGEEHYNLISALHKSLRNSDPDAGLYWLARMVEAGEDPLYIARRLVRFASEDVGNADPAALTVAVAAKDAVHFIGLPEGNTALAQAVTYLATAPKSNAVYAGYAQAAEDVRREVAEPVPLHLRNAPTRLLRQLDYGRGYEHAHDDADAVTGMDCLPPSLQGRHYYRPTDRGHEKAIGRRLQAWRDLKRTRRARGQDSG